MERAQLERPFLVAGRRALRSPDDVVDPPSAGVLALGALAGNRAVVSLLARHVQRIPEEEPTPAPPVEEPEASVNAAAPPAPEAGPESVNAAAPPEARPGAKAVDVAAAAPGGGPEEVSPTEATGEEPGLHGNLQGRWLAKVVAPSQSGAAAMAGTPPDLSAAIDALDAAVSGVGPIAAELRQARAEGLAGRTVTTGAWLLGVRNTLAASRRRQSDAALREHVANAAADAVAMGPKLAGR